MQHPHLPCKFWLSSSNSGGGGGNCENNFDQQHQHLFMGRIPEKFPLLKNKCYGQDALHLPYDSLKLRFRQTPPLERMQYRLSWNNTNASQSAAEKMSNVPYSIYPNDQKRLNSFADDLHDSSKNGHSPSLFPYSSAVCTPENLREIRRCKRLQKSPSSISGISSEHAVQNIHKSTVNNSQSLSHGKEGSNSALNFDLRSLRIGEMTPDNMRNAALSLKSSRIKYPTADLFFKRSVREAEEIISIGALIPPSTSLSTISNTNGESEKVSNITRKRFNSLNDSLDNSEYSSQSYVVKQNESINDKCTYVDPLMGGSSSFNQRLSDLATLEQETMRWERSRVLRKKRFSKSD